jgi:hypothetical protein
MSEVSQTARTSYPVMTNEQEAEFWAAVQTVRAFRRFFEEAGEAGRTLSQADINALWDAACKSGRSQPSRTPARHLRVVPEPERPASRHGRPS